MTGEGREKWAEAKKWGLVRRDRNGNSRITKRGREVFESSAPTQWCPHCIKPLPFKD